MISTLHSQLTELLGRKLARKKGAGGRGRVEIGGKIINNLKQLLMKVRVKAGLHLSTKKMTTKTTEATHTFSLDNEAGNCYIDFAHLVSVIHLNRNRSQEIKRRLRPGRAAMGELRKIFKGKDASLKSRLRPSTARGPQTF